MAISDLACFILEGSLCPAPYAIIPNFISPSFRYLEKEENGSVVLTGFPSFHPAIDPNTGSFLLQPRSSNLLTYNIDISKSIWQKGSKVSISNNVADIKCPDGTMAADVISWANGQGNTQIFKRDISVDKASTYTFSAFFMLRGGKFGANDVLSISGDIAEAKSIKLAALNDSSAIWKTVEATFKSTGNQPTLPSDYNVTTYTISNVSSNTITIQNCSGIIAGALKDAVVNFVDDAQNRSYTITSNTASDTLSNVVLTLDKNTLITDQVTTSLVLRLNPPSSCIITIQLYSENNISLAWGGAQLEKLAFRTGMIYQLNEIQSRSRDSLEYTENPVKNLSTFSIFVEIEEWRGAGNIFETSNFKIFIDDNKKINAQAGSITVISQDALPTSCSVLVQISRESSSLSIFVNNILVGKESISSFKAEDSILTLTSNGYRLYRRLIVFNGLLKDGQPNLGQNGELDVQEVFANRNIIPPSTINIINPLLLLPAMTVAAATKAAAKTDITAINTGTRVITVTDATSFPTSGLAKIIRNNALISWVLITAKTGNNITIDNVTNLQVGDFITGSQSDSPGYSSIRFPCRYDDLQLISAVNSGTLEVTLGSTLSFVRGSKVVVTTDTFQDVGEYLVTSIDNVNSKLILSAVDNIAVGHYIYQPLPGREMRIPPALYIPFIMNDMDGVRVAIAGENGVVIENNWSVPMTVTVGIRYAG